MLPPSSGSLRECRIYIINRVAYLDPKPYILLMYVLKGLCGVEVRPLIVQSTGCWDTFQQNLAGVLEGTWNITRYMRSKTPNPEP